MIINEEDEVLSNNKLIDQAVNKTISDFILISSHNQNKLTNTSDPIIQRGEPYFDVYTSVAIIVIGCVIICLVVASLVAYKMRINYKLQRQVNMFKRIDQQLGREREYVISSWACKRF